MSIVASFFGYAGAVEYRFIQNLSLRLTRQDGQAELHASGSIMESAQVFKSLRARVNRDSIMVTVFSCLPFWNRNGSPEFDSTVRLNVGNGTYSLIYEGPEGAKTFIERIELR